MQVDRGVSLDDLTIIQEAFSSLYTCLPGRHPCSWVSEPPRDDFIFLPSQHPVPNDSSPFLPDIANNQEAKTPPSNSDVLENQFFLNQV